MDVFEKIAAGAYDNKIPYSARPKKPSRFSVTTAAAARKLADDLEEYEAAHKAWLKASDMYNTETRELKKEFVRDLEEYYDMTSHPRAYLLFEKAWEMSHSDGYHAVAVTYGDLSELMS